jgi:hypothetical protein
MIEANRSRAEQLQSSAVTSLSFSIKPGKQGSFQSAPASSVYRRWVTVDLLLLTISDLTDELYSSVVSS